MQKTIEIVEKEDLEKKEARENMNSQLLNLARDISTHIVTWNDRKQVTDIKIDKIEYLKIVSDVKNFLLDKDLTCKIEDRLQEEFMEEYRENGIYKGNRPYFEDFLRLTFELKDYNIDLERKLNLKSVFFNELLSKKEEYLNQAGILRDSDGNLVSEQGLDYEILVGTKESLTSYLTKKEEKINIIKENTPDKNVEDFEKLNKEIKNIKQNLQYYSAEEVLNLYAGDDHLIISNDIELLNRLEDSLYDVIEIEDKENEEDEEEEEA